MVTKATPNGYIDSKCHINRLKSSINCLIGYSDFISCSWPRGRTHTHTSTHTCILTSRTKAISRNQACGRHAPGLKCRFYLVIFLNQGLVVSNEELHDSTSHQSETVAHPKLYTSMCVLLPITCSFCAVNILWSL